VKKGLVPAAVIIIAFLAFEAWTLHKAAYRMEPLYLFEVFVAAGRADALCGEPEPARRERFAHNRGYARDRAARELRKQDPAITDSEIDRRLAALVAGREDQVDALVAAKGCDDDEVRALLKRFEIRSRRAIG
jgi:hypothetical protein